MTRIAILNIGTELLRGRTVNTNAATMGKMLRAAGFTVETTLVIHDTEDVIKDSIKALMAAHDAVLVTGGLGPTKDDITKRVLLEMFGGEMVCHAPTLARIAGFLSRHGRKMLDHNRRQADVPSSSIALDNEMGTSPGMAFVQGEKLLFSIPGVPFEMRHLMKTQLIPMLKKQFPPRFLLTQVVRTAGVPESRIAEKMESIEPEISPDIEIAYLPSTDGTKIELKLQGEEADAEKLQADLDQTRELVVALFSKYVYSLEDKRPDRLLAEYLLREGLTIATAESCTGGGIAGRLVRNSGISAALKGGVVAYMREVKENMLGVAAETIDEKGIVSEGVAREMAEGARKALGSDIALSITGWAEAAADAAPEDQPQAWIGFADATGSTAIHIKLFKNRSVNLDIAVNAALIYALRMLKAA